MVLISHLYKVVFIHIPKTGGSFIRSIMNKVDPNCINIEFFNDNQLSGHHPFYLIKQLDVYEQINNYTFFCVAREPIDLLISHYNYILTCNNEHYLYSQINNKSIYDPYVIDILFYNNQDLNLYYIKQSDEKYDEIENPINEKMIILNFNTLQKDFKNFLLNICKISENVINDINFNIKINESDHLIKNDYEKFEKTIINEEYKKTIEQNKKMFNKLTSNIP
jgi:hypothetical protein